MQAEMYAFLREKSANGSSRIGAFAERIAVEFVVVSLEMIHVVCIVVAGDVEVFVWVQMK